MRRAGKLLAAGLTLWLLILAFRQASLLTLLLPTVSLRYDTPLEKTQVEAALAYGEKSGGPCFTFWAESSTWVSAEERGSAARQVIFRGEPEVAYPTAYRHGTAPVSPGACAVSTGLAWALWGGGNVVGLELTVEEDIFRVTGVFEEDEPLLLRPGEGAFTAAELSGIPRGQDGYRFAASYGESCGLGTPEEVLWGPGFAGWAQVLAWLPVALAGGRLFPYGLRQARRLPGFRRSALRFGLAFLLALALPWLLEQLPAWLLPTKWSDFSFWSRLGQTLLNRCRDLLSLSPQTRDVGVKLAMVKESLYVLAACILSGALYRSTEITLPPHTS